MSTCDQSKKGMGDAGVANKHAHTHRETNWKEKMRLRRVEIEYSSTAAETIQAVARLDEINGNQILSVHSTFVM